VNNRQHGERDDGWDRVEIKQREQHQDREYANRIEDQGQRRQQDERCCCHVFFSYVVEAERKGGC